jgi:hypothetical protein
MAPRSWSEWLASVVILGVVALCAFGAGVAYQTYALHHMARQLDDAQKENDRMKEIVQRAEIEEKALKDKLAGADIQLNDVFNAYRTIVLNGNETASVSTGHFMVGLVGPPTNEKVSINVNGTQHTVAAGDSVDVGASNCRVEVKSFDMFKATLLTSCPPTKP